MIRRLLAWIDLYLARPLPTDEPVRRWHELGQFACCRCCAAQCPSQHRVPCSTACMEAS